MRDEWVETAMRDEWVETALGDCLEQVHRPVRVDELVDVPFAGVRWYAAGVYPRVTEAARDVKTRTLNRIESGDITYNRMWASKAAFGVVRSDSAGCLVTNDFPVFRPRDRVISDWVGLVFQSPAFQRDADLLASGTTERRRLKEEAFKSIRIPLPPLPVQRRIVDLMEHLDTHLANLETERVAAAGAYAALRQDLFAGLPATRMLTDVLEAVRAGGTPSRKRPDFFGGGIPWLKSGEVDNSHVHFTAESLSPEGLRSSSAWLVPEGAVVVAMYGQGDTKGTAGYLDRSMSTNQAVLALVPVAGLSDGRFLLHWMRWHTDVLRAAASGAAQPNLSKDTVLRVVRFPDMELAEQRRAAGLLDAASDLDRDLASEARSMKSCRTALLSRILERQVELPDDYEDLLDVAS